MTRPPKNVAASVRQRLLDRARDGGEDFQLVLTRYATERFLYRLAKSRHRDRFVLKGAVLFAVWTGRLHRVTRDLDLLGRGSPDVVDLERVVAEICETDVEDDGITFDAASVRGEPIREAQLYDGIRLKLQAGLAGARIAMQVDVGFGDAVTPRPRVVVVPSLLDLPEPRLKAYTRETVIAEKYEAMVSLGIANSRLKDFFDVWWLAREFEFDGPTLLTAIEATFRRRGSPVPEGAPLALTPEFSSDAAKQTQWAAFVRRAGVAETAPSLPAVVELVAALLLPPSRALGAGDVLEGAWSAGGPWSD